MRNAEHVLVCGPSGGGKSTLLRELHARHGGPSTFLTPKNDDGPEPDPASSRYVRESARYPSDLKAAREWARSSSEVCQVIVDEVQSAPSFTAGEGPVKDGLHEDRGSGVKWVIGTQNPMDLNTSENGYGPVQQAQYWVFVGPAKDWHIGFFRANNMADLIDRLPAENYEYVVIEPTASLSPEEKIRYRGETDERYA